MTTNPGDPQLLLAYYAAVRKHPKDVFVSRHPNPFLLYAPTMPDRDSGFTTASGLHSIEIIRTEGTQAGLVGSQTMVVEVHKSTRNPFPDQVYVGRADNNDIIFDHASVSKSHAYLKATGATWGLFDMESSNGSFVARQKAVPYTALAIADGDAVLFGDVECKWMSAAALYDFITQQLVGT